MKKILSASLAALVLATSIQLTSADEQPKEVAKSALSTKRSEIITQIRLKLKDGKDKESDLAENFKAIDALIANHTDGTADEVAELYMVKADIYAQVLDNDTKATAILNQVKKDFPGSGAAKNADMTLASIKAGAAAKAIQRNLVTGAKFPDFDEKDLAGQPLSVAKFKGKVVLLDFWATWCGPCRAEIPNVVKIYQEQHSKGFEVIGISLDSDRAKLDKFLAEKNMTWPQYFDGKGWSNKLSGKYGVRSIPATYLIDREGKIIASDLRGEELAAAVAKAIGQK